MGLTDILWTCDECGWTITVVAGPLTATVQQHECFGNNCNCNNRGTGHWAAGHDPDCDYQHKITGPVFNL